MRVDPQVNAVAQQVMSLLMREIPALAQAPSAAPTTVPPTRPTAPPMATTSAMFPTAPTSHPLLGVLGQQQPAVPDPGQQRLDFLQHQLDELRLQQAQARVQGQQQQQQPQQVDPFNPLAGLGHLVSQQEPTQVNHEVKPG